MDAITREILMQADSQMADICMRRRTGGAGDTSLQEEMRFITRHRVEEPGVSEAICLAPLCMVPAETSIERSMSHV
ncbi:MAG: hypothetical protein IIZ39_04935 [Blautia sp.]|nr:hypothetical protein [Blautia sp.]